MMLAQLSGLRTLALCGGSQTSVNSPTDCDRHREKPLTVRSRALHIVGAAKGDGCTLVAMAAGDDDAAEVAGTLLDANLAVLLTPARWRTGPWRGNLGIGYDGSRDAEAAAAIAGAIARAADGSVAQIDVAYIDTSASAASEIAEHTLDERRRKIFEWWLAERAAHLPARVRVSCLTGDPAEELTSLSEDLDLLIVGSRGRAPLRRIFTGSVSRELMTMCRCPLLVVPASIADHR